MKERRRCDGRISTEQLVLDRRSCFFIWMHASGMGCGGHGSHDDGEERKKREQGGHQH